MMTRQEDISRNSSLRKKNSIFFLVVQKTTTSNTTTLPAKARVFLRISVLISCYILHATDHRKSFFFCCV